MQWLEYKGRRSGKRNTDVSLPPLRSSLPPSLPPNRPAPSPLVNVVFARTINSFSTIVRSLLVCASCFANLLPGLPFLDHARSSSFSLSLSRLEDETPASIFLPGLPPLQNMHSIVGIYPTDWYRRSGSPTFSISGIVHLRSNALDRTILKI
jgi:hypothetical protein